MTEYTPTETVSPRGYKWMQPGERYAQVVTLKRISTRKWLCQCDCGIVFETYGTHLRSGVTTSCGHWRAKPNPESYNAVHLRLSSMYGPASNYPCVECGNPATSWAYNRSGVGERVAERDGYEVTYSADESQYDPCCGPCHYRRDHV